ncbi:MAG: ComF family protein [Planctomycetota bacterium]|jgi:ComF family protein|nr:ComF family protein [Planctomycetota bacterium]
MPNRPFSFFRAAWSAFADGFYPPACLACGRSLWLWRDAFLCAECENNWSLLNDNGCRRCGEPLGRYAAGVCQRCRTKKPAFTRAIAVAPYREGATDALVKDFKYHGNRRLAKPLAELLAARIRRCWSLDKIDLLTAVPLHPDRYAWRGYNQSWLLAEELAARLPLPAAAVLRRVRDTPAQANLSVEARRQNLRDAFAAVAPLTGKKILLIDDVLTTGTTANECARALRRAGATRVFVATFAR